MNDSEPFQRANSAALRFISYRPRSEAEVRARLRRDFPEDLVEEVVDALKGQAHLDDATFASLWRDARASLNPRSADTIRRELISKGVDQGLADEAISLVDDEDGAYRVALKFARRLQCADVPTFNRKLRGYLRRRGFGESVARSAIARARDEVAQCR